MTKLLVTTTVVAWLACAGRTHAADRVYVESKVLATGQTACTVGVYVDNDFSVGKIHLALEMHTTLGAAFPAGSASIVVNPAGRLSGTLATKTFGTAAGICSEGGGDYQTMDPADFQSPDAVYASLHHICHAPGIDPAGIPSFFLIFDANTAPGSFGVRACCTVDGVTFMHGLGCSEGDAWPTVTPGTITLTTCNAAPTDVNCDGAADILDVVTLVNTAFRSQAPPPPCCVTP